MNRPHGITATVEIPESGAEGVLLCQGTAAGGYSLYVKDGRLHYVHNYVGRGLYSVDSEDELPVGKHELRFEFEPTGEPDLAAGKGAPGHLQLYVDGTLVGERRGSDHDPVRDQPGRAHLRLQPGLTGHDRLHLAVRVHGDDREGHGRRQRQADRRPRGRAPRPPGAAVEQRRDREGRGGDPRPSRTAQREKVAACEAFEPNATNQGDPSLSFHCLQHSYASLMLAANVNPHTLQELMGHESIKVTLDTYGHLYEGASDSAVASLDSFLAKNAKKPSRSKAR